ncbi:MAG: helix-turn-helix transcriptional regulator [Clostridiales bacterium]|nr:helix-turn-helix transcriptional regulator [Clostridiales bacterium]
MLLNKAFSERVRQLLKEKGLTQYKLSQLTGIYQSTLADILNCKYDTPNFRNMVLIIRELGVSMSEFFDSELFNFDLLDIKEK